MVRLGTISAAAGAVAGLWNIWAYYQTCRGPSCPVQTAAPPGVSGTVVLGLAAVLVVGSLATFLAPSALFYLLAIIGLIIEAIEVLNYSFIGPGPFYVTLVLMTLSVALSLFAAARRTGVSEQSNPMNLPVFG